MNDPLISIIIPTQNRYQLLAKALNSACNQTYQNIEIIVIDDASRDETSQYVSNLRLTDRRVTLIKNTTPVGGAKARNMGLAESRGEFIAFLDDDDEWFPEKLAIQSKALQVNPDCVAISCGFEIIYPSGKIKTKIPKSSVSIQDLYSCNFLGGASMLFCRAEVLKKINGFDPLLKSCQDWDLWVRLAKQGRILVSHQLLVKYTLHAGERITTNFRSAYLGHRRFYFKFKDEMPTKSRLRCLLLLIHIRYRSAFILRKHMWILLLCARNIPFRQTLSFSKISFWLLMQKMLIPRVHS